MILHMWMKMCIYTMMGINVLIISNEDLFFEISIKYSPSEYQVSMNKENITEKWQNWGVKLFNSPVFDTMPIVLYMD